jgi:hypothetical protein
MTDEEVAVFELIHFHLVPPWRQKILLEQRRASSTIPVVEVLPRSYALMLRDQSSKRSGHAVERHVDEEPKILCRPKVSDRDG